MSTLLKFSNNIICDCPLQNKRFRCPIERMYSFSKVKLCISLKFYRQCLREDGHVWFRHFFHGQRSTRINIYHCCSVLYCWCLCTCCFSYLPSLQFVVPSNKINVTEHVPIEHNGRESNICCVITYLCNNFVPFSYLPSYFPSFRTCASYQENFLFAVDIS